jgi:uncharacterized repeat protein (TIGR01451 family)
VTVTGPETGTVGDPLGYTVTVTNAGPDPSEGVTASVDLPVQLLVDSAVPERGSCSGAGPVSCDLGSLEPGTGVSVLISAWAVAGGTASVQASVAGSTVDPQAGDDTAARTTALTGPDCTVVGTPQGDTLEGTVDDDVICALGGDDVVAGEDGDDALLGGPGDDRLSGDGGRDSIDGGDGVDTASWESAGRGVRVDLSTGVATRQGTDRLQRVENLTGSRFDDLLVGSGGPNVLVGGMGTDVLYGGDGDDTLSGGRQDDYLSGGDGTDTGGGGTGVNTCEADLEDAASCVPPSPSDGDDTGGPLDVRAVHLSRSSRPEWRVLTFSRWRVRRVWDEGYVMVLLDTRSGPGFDYYAVVRSTGGRLEGLLFRSRSGADTLERSVEVWRESRRDVFVGVPLSAVSVASGRAYVRWRAATMYTDTGCARVCLDRVPRSGGGVMPTG